MFRLTAVLAFLLLACGTLAAQVPPEERIPITDPDRLEEMGFRRDSANVAVWSKADLGRRTGDAPRLTPTGSDTFGTGSGYSTAFGYELLEEIDSTKLGRFEQETECYGNQTNGGPTYALARISVPDGVSLKFFRFWALDSDPDVDLLFDVYETCQATGYDPPVRTLIAESFTFGSIGNYFSFASLHDLTANNRDCGYSVRVKLGGFGVPCSLNLRVRKLQFSWLRQISPAPASATFADVPTGHPYFRAIEALNDSGITQGCGGGNFCPGGNVTRGEMAAFLARALGLSWP